MFGYININKEQLSEKGKSEYQAFYCGLCRMLKEKCGIKGQMLINYDMTFLVILLSGLYELKNEECDFVCPVHPGKKQHGFLNEATEYAAEMNVLFAYQNFEDDWKDDRSYTKKMLTKIFDKDYARIRKRYPRQAAAVDSYMSKLEMCEKHKEKNLDVIAGLTGEMLAEIFAWKKDDIWEEELRCFGFYLGKFIYLMDAYEDVEQDKKKKQYNPLIELQKENETDFDMFCQLMLTSMVSECSKCFEKLPIIEYVEILRNTLYSGVWTKYEYLQIKKNKRRKRNA
ncbi:MAG: hypothetical protein HFG80_07555 [Eubacterium sp.]|nr:hypothetical protein [Eubacterium sp.]